MRYLAIPVIALLAVFAFSEARGAGAAGGGLSRHSSPITDGTASTSRGSASTAVRRATAVPARH